FEVAREIVGVRRLVPVEVGALRHAAVGVVPDAIGHGARAAYGRLRGAGRPGDTQYLLIAVGPRCAEGIELSRVRKLPRTAVREPMLIAAAAMLGTDRPAIAVVLEGRETRSVLGDAGKRTGKASRHSGASGTIIDVGRLVVVIETHRAIGISDRREVAEV